MISLSFCIIFLRIPSAESAVPTLLLYVSFASVSAGVYKLPRSISHPTRHIFHRYSARIRIDVTFIGIFMSQLGNTSSTLNSHIPLDISLPLFFFSLSAPTPHPRPQTPPASYDVNIDVLPMKPAERTIHANIVSDDEHQ